MGETESGISSEEQTEEERLFGRKGSSYSVVDVNGGGFQVIPDDEVDEFLRRANVHVEGQVAEAKVISSGRPYGEAKEEFYRLEEDK